MGALPTSAFTALLAIHGLIHLLGVVKAFGLAELPTLSEPIGKPVGVLFGLGALAFVASAVVLTVAPDRFLWVALPALVLSQAAILFAWKEAKIGTLANLIVLVPVALGLLELRASSFRSIYEREAAQRLAPRVEPPLVRAEDLERLPALLATYLERVGAVGKPRVRGFRARFRGTMKPSPEADWMAVRVEQHEFFGPATRLFLLRGSRFGLPFEAWHRYAGGAATMQVRLLSLLEVVDARGAEMNQSETVTLFNDMCLLAPASLLDARVTWQELDTRTLRGTFENGNNVIRADLVFDASGDLANFVSEDRYQSADGKTYKKLRWSTPVSGYRSFGGVRLGASGQAVWTDEKGDFPYARFELEEIEYNPGGECLSRAGPPGC